MVTPSLHKATLNTGTNLESTKLLDNVGMTKADQDTAFIHYMFNLMRVSNLSKKKKKKENHKKLAKTLNYSLFLNDVSFLE